MQEARAKEHAHVMSHDQCKDPQSCGHSAQYGMGKGMNHDHCRDQKCQHHGHSGMYHGHQEMHNDQCKDSKCQHSSQGTHNDHCNDNQCQHSSHSGQQGMQHTHNEHCKDKCPHSMSGQHEIRHEGERSMSSSEAQNNEKKIH